MAEAIRVELEKTGNGWQLNRGGEPYFIKGAGGDASLQQLAAAGANSIRTWGADDIGELLDQAEALGLTVAVGIWLGHERHGFDYNDETQVSEQLGRARKIVLRYKDHPAVLLWGIGNEMEGFGEGDNEAIWTAVNDVAAMVKEIDPYHPTMSVTAFVHGGRIEYLHKRSPAIDIHGVNAYGGAQVVPQHLRAGGATKPFVLTEFGPLGPWEMPKTPWLRAAIRRVGRVGRLGRVGRVDGGLLGPGFAVRGVLENGVLDELALHEARQLEARELEQLDRLLQLGRHHQLLAEA